MACWKRTGRAWTWDPSLLLQRGEESAERRRIRAGPAVDREEVRNGHGQILLRGRRSLVDGEGGERSVALTDDLATLPQLRPYPLRAAGPVDEQHAIAVAEVFLKVASDVLGRAVGERPVTLDLLLAERARDALRERQVLRVGVDEHHHARPLGPRDLRGAPGFFEHGSLELLHAAGARRFEHRTMIGIANRVEIERAVA